jgi:hypothetical protein
MQFRHSNIADLPAPMGQARAHTAKATFSPHLIGTLPLPLRRAARFLRLNATQDRADRVNANEGGIIMQFTGKQRLSLVDFIAYVALIFFIGLAFSIVLAGAVLVLAGQLV